MQCDDVMEQTLNKTQHTLRTNKQKIYNQNIMKKKLLY